MKYTTLLSLMLFSAGLLAASQAQQMLAGLEVDAVEKLADSYKQQGYKEISQDEFETMHLTGKTAINKFLSGKMSTLVESKLEEIRKGEEIVWRQKQFIIVKVKDDSPRFFVKESVKA